MECLEVDEKTARDVMEYDKLVDQGKPTPYDLTPEQKKAEKKARSTGTRKTVYNFSKRERKVDTGKVNIVNLLADALKAYNPTIVKAEREIAFSIDGIEYSVTLTKHRAKKWGDENWTKDSKNPNWHSFPSMI